MSAKKNKEVVRRFFDEVCNGGLDEKVYDIFADKVSFNGKQGSPEGVIRFLKRIRMSFALLRVEVKEQIAERDIVSTRRVWTGTPRKRSHPSFGKLITWNEISIVRLVDNKIVEDWKEESKRVRVIRIARKK
ncbi:MAG: ester cyclase [Chitinophagaceae bacterium]|nr:ester cyclase [Chitinophagaceae bacterium]